MEWFSKRGLPDVSKREMYVLTSQLRRACDSASLNIAEGSTGQTNAEFSRFVGFSIRSGIEMIGCIYLARRRSIITEKDFNSIYTKTDTLVKRIQALRNTLR
jgi:four helix bundle protein